MLGICLFCTFKTKEKPQPPPAPSELVQPSTRSIITGDEDQTVAETDCSKDEKNDNDDHDFEELDTDSNDSGECAYHIDDLDLDLDPDLDLEGAKKNLPTTKIRSSR